jgi:hypothetical protein
MTTGITRPESTGTESGQVCNQKIRVSVIFITSSNFFNSNNNNNNKSIIGAHELPNRATAVETSPTSHIVTHPIFPLTTTTTTTDVQPPLPPLSPWSMPMLGPSQGMLVDSATANFTTQQRHVTGQQLRQPRLVTAPNNPATSPTTPPRHHRPKRPP